MIFPYTCEAEAASTIRLQAGRIHLPKTKKVEEKKYVNNDGDSEKRSKT